MRTLLVLSAVSALALSCPTALAAGDAKAGREKVKAVCQTCHGLDGIAKIPEAANLAGQTKEYLTKALGDFKSGARKNEIMSVIIEQLTKDDIANLAAYYSAIKIKAEVPPQ
jgi:cytochrome c553